MKVILRHRKTYQYLTQTGIGVDRGWSLTPTRDLASVFDDTDVLDGPLANGFAIEPLHPELTRGTRVMTEHGLGTLIEREIIDGIESNRWLVRLDKLPNPTLERMQTTFGGLYIFAGALKEVQS